MVYEILATTPFGKEKKGEVGIERLVDEGAYQAAFPLHDVRKHFLIPIMIRVISHHFTGAFRVPWPRCSRRQVERETNPLPVLGQVGQVVQVPTPGSHQVVLWREDSHLLRLAGVLHRLAPSGGRGGRDCLPLRRGDDERQPDC